MRFFPFFICLFLLCTKLNAQLSETIETDRPDQTESPFTTPHKWFQSETGFSIENQKDGSKAFVHPSMLNKYGLTKRFELRLITEFASFQTPIVISNDKDRVTGLEPIEIGGKVALAEEKGWLPKTSLIFHVGIPKAASKEFQLQKWAPNFRFTMQHSLTKTISLGYNLGAEWPGIEGENPTFIYTLAPGFEIGERWYAYIEVFGFLNDDNHPQHSFDGGVAYNFSPNTKIDLSGGFGLTPNTALKNYIALGFSFRLPLSK